jgi:ankyrin repeat protein
MIKRIMLCAVLGSFCVPAAGDALSEANSKADRVHSNGKTALMVAARDGDTDRIESLIRLGADVNRTNTNGGTPIMYAALSGKPETVSVLLKHHADLNTAAANGWTALMIACVKGYVDVARLLLKHGAKPNRADIYSWTPLMRAVYESRLGTARLLAEHEATNVNQRGENGVTALHLAVIKGNADMVEILLAGGADPTIRDASGRTAMDFARKNKNLSLVRVMENSLAN